MLLIIDITKSNKINKFILNGIELHFYRTKNQNIQTECSHKMECTPLISSPKISKLRKSMFLKVNFPLENVGKGEVIFLECS